MAKKLSKKIAHFIDVHEEQRDDVLTIKQIVKKFGHSTFAISFLVLSLPSALPLPAPGYSTPFGIAIAALAIQMIFGRKRPWLPKKIENIKLKFDTITKMLAFCEKFLKKLEHIIKPRLKLFRKKIARRLIGLSIFLMAIIMIVPLPLTNTIPAFIIFILAVSLIETDGLLSIAGLILSFTISILYFASFYILIFYGKEGLIQTKNYILNLF